jgi:hypothetical protein
MARDAWQLEGLSRAELRVLGDVDRGEGVRATGAVAKELESRLLVVSRQVHTAEGRHELALQSWRAWAAATRSGRARSVAAARKTLESSARALGAPADALPWNGRIATSGRPRGARR